MANGVQEFSAQADPQRSWTLQEENDWLRAVLRLAEAHIKHEKEELKSLRVVFDRSKQDAEQHYLALEARVRAAEKDKQDFELRIFREREQIRSLEASLNDLRARSVRTQELVQKAYSDEQGFLENVRKLKASFAGEKARLEQEVSRVRASLMQADLISSCTTPHSSSAGEADEGGGSPAYRATESQNRMSASYQPALSSSFSGQPTLSSSLSGQPSYYAAGALRSEHLYM
ncbi:hypothetical protein GUITHDRAFT_115372 [Guillardia theta CCMP2712]|uniref:Uncharacterized protein n=1 Tax=Guillardia theta (strain CCMP2712) TaxID=905079 RepID=L1IRZ7_GUITC|nr:hypothetical protein GUITHDRAFT_115372 [Guillardia theta CCMP2712]EKX38600.1 hypothetical protein GUITHDRAFT_115372 [Guillardia theta CCMP2712]|eukprot:XP_005825580.1 hypothetical protein GUITHDRAFT_115372 [Guillardia theta CCMP2712]